MTLGFPPAAGGDAGRSPRCRSIIAHRLQLLYNNVLRHFDQVYLEVNYVSALRANGLLPRPSQDQMVAPHQPRAFSSDPSHMFFHETSDNHQVVTPYQPRAPPFSDPSHIFFHETPDDYLLATPYRAWDNSTLDESDSSPLFSNAALGDANDLLDAWTDIAGRDTMLNAETPTPVHIFVSTPTSSTPVDAKDGGKRARDDDTDAPTPGVSGAPSPKRVKSDWEGPPNEDPRKCERAENVKTDETKHGAL